MSDVGTVTPHVARAWCDDAAAADEAMKLLRLHVTEDPDRDRVRTYAAAACALIDGYIDRTVALPGMDDEDDPTPPPELAQAHAAVTVELYLRTLDPLGPARPILDQLVGGWGVC